jgi:hypothetical protein
MLAFITTLLQIQPPMDAGGVPVVDKAGVENAEVSMRAYGVVLSGFRSKKVSGHS